MRLAEGNSVYEGLVEVCLGERWGSVCSDGWTAADANVTCRQLGHPSNGGKILYNYCNMPLSTVDEFLILRSLSIIIYKKIIIIEENNYSLKYG